MPIKLDKRALKTYDKLPSAIKKKAQKQFLLLDISTSHPSLHSKKMKGINRFEARIDYHYRFTFVIENDTLYILTIGMHDKGLGKK